ncbi:unnamed protein product [Tuber melanosporum]|uniref:(Perigord truffle) hypothetical protein n=1 Tax=Tuber melanosporum (strain Mel28) TaxID=656061 RepID=D5G6V0_TUBMM|nr:uncharacterized protein GSTUM_00002282001 [Tuber melanosporum]CAZ80243.1 unnamed protein product [Tuber melanosporum]
MSELTVGQVSGIINLCVVIVQLTLPLAFVLILVAFLENENNAVTWSVVGRALQASMWPSILSADSAASRGVRKRVTFITTLSTVALIILAVAGVVTPLGLNEEVTPSFTEPVAFGYLKDTSTFGQGTGSRSGYVFSRLCGWMMWQNCPGTFAGFTYTANRTGMYLNGTDDAYLDTKVPQNITEIFKSGTSGRGNLISGPFDVQHRLFINVKDSDVRNNASKRVPMNQGKVHTKGVAATLRSVILDDNFVLVEGLIVDAKSGGVGFRNHSAPANLQYGGTWEESLLWVEPVSQCVDNNFTIDFTINADRNVDDLHLTDHGGWVNLVRDRPDFDRADSQLDVQLWQRAYKGAWVTNMIAASFHNVTRNITSLGKSYSLMGGNSRLGLSGYKTTAIGVGDMNGSWMKGSRKGIDTSKNFTAANTLCIGSAGVDMSNITNVAVKCSTLLGAAKRADGGDPGKIYDVGSRWSIPIYTCATVVKASVKVVTLTMNGTHTLENLRVDKVVPKNYSSTSAMPVWAVEDTGMKINDVDPFWGIVDPKYKDAPHLWTIQREHLWLPSVGDGVSAPLDSSSSFGLLSVPGAALAEISTEDDYSGERNFALLTKWRKLSATQNSTGSILNLIWTDIVANNLVGTKSVPSAYGVADAGGSSSAGMLVVETYSKKITYDLLFAIPAFMILAMWVASLFIALLMWIASRVSLAVVRELINQTSTGRSITNLLYPEACAHSAPTRVWVKNAGRKKMGFVSLREKGDDGDGSISDAGTREGGAQRTGTGLRFGEVEQSGSQAPVGKVFNGHFEKLG